MMKILFVCVANINRSQIAAGIFNKLSKKNTAKNAGLKPRMAGAYLKEESNNPVTPMKKAGYDISHAKIKKLNAEMVRWADKVVLIFNWKKHEKEVPDYLRNFPNKEVWEVYSISDKTPYNEYCKLEKKRIKLIERQVKALIKRIG